MDNLFKVCRACWITLYVTLVSVVMFPGSFSSLEGMDECDTYSGYGFIYFTFHRK